MHLLNLLAHSDEFHSADTSELEHILTTAWVAVPLYLAINLVLFYVLRERRKSLILPVLLGLNLLIGVLTYELVPAVSIIAITVGITSALFAVLTLLSGESS